jgi:hypothetical protein
MKASYRFVFIREQKFTWQIFAVLKAKFGVAGYRNFMRQNLSNLHHLCYSFYVIVFHCKFFEKMGKKFASLVNFSYIRVIKLLQF